MKINGLISKISAIALCPAIFSGCSGIPKNTVFSVDDLNGKTIGVQLETTGDFYASEIQDAAIERFTKGADAILALKQGNVDAVIIDADPANIFVENNSDLMILDEKLTEEDYAIAIKKGNTELLDKINGALANLQKNGTLDAIKNNWIGKDASKEPMEFASEESELSGNLTMATNAEFPPYESMSGENIIGFDVDMMRAVCAELDMELQIENIEFDAILTAVDMGTADVGVAGLTVDSERLQYVDFSIPYTTATQVIVVRKK